MKKKLTALCLVLALGVTAIIGGTLAYFTDTDKATNVMTVGNVDVTLYESKLHRTPAKGQYLEWEGQENPVQDQTIIDEYTNGDYKEYLDGTTLMPVKFSQSITAEALQECAAYKNAYVKNTGNNDAYVRVRYIVPANVAQYLDIVYTSSHIVDSLEKAADKDDMMISDVNWNGADVAAQTQKRDSQTNVVLEFTYVDALAKDEMVKYSPISVIMLLSSVTQQNITALNLTNAQFNIQVEVDAIQADGFANAVEAFEAFDARG